MTGLRQAWRLRHSDPGLAFDDTPRDGQQRPRPIHVDIDLHDEEALALVEPGVASRLRKLSDCDLCGVWFPAFYIADVFGVRYCPYCWYNSPDEVQ